MAKTSYLGANVETTDTFAQWLVRTNQITYDMGTVVLTAGSVSQPNTTNGASTTGNTHLEGILSANTYAVVGSLRGGTVSTPNTLSITGNTSFSNSAIVFFENTVNQVHSNTNVLFTKNFTVNAASNDVSITANNFTSNTVITLFDGSIINLYTTNTNIGETSADTLTIPATAVISGSANLTNSVTMSATSQMINLGTSQTTGIFNIGSTTGTGTISVGRSTASQVLNLGTGNTTSGNTKTINIGTEGQSGSNTTINIGSNTSLTDVYNDLRLNRDLVIGREANKATVTYPSNVARAYTIPQVGANADFVMTQGAQTISGVKTFANNVIVDASLSISGDLIISGNSSLSTSNSIIDDLTVLETFTLFPGAYANSEFSPATTLTYDLGGPSNAWRTLYANTVILSSSSSDPNGAVRADRTFQFQAGQNISIGGAGTTAQNLTANRSWSISAANTNLSTSANTTVRTISSSTGTSVSLPTANTTQAGMMSSADRTKLDGIEAGAQVNVATNLGTSANTTVRTITSSTGSNVSLPTANTTQAGMMSSADRTKLDGIESGAQVNVATNLSIGSSTGTTVRIDSSTGTNASLPIASDTLAGVVTNSAQTFAGVKTFNSTIIGSISGNAATATKTEATTTGTTTIELVRGNMADSDSFRIAVGGTASDSGFVEIATADNGNEPIYVRQYSGNFTTQVRSATLLDASGNTSFPGSVSATSFIGSLSGNATTASSLLNSRTITLTGDVSGSVSFDGTNNVFMATTIQPNSVALGTDTTGNYMVNVSEGGGISISHTQSEGSTATISHADTSSQGSVNNSNGTVIQDVTLDTYGHITALGSTNLDSRYLQLSGGTTTGTITAPTFNATSSSGGGFQGIAADGASAPSFTWTGYTNTGIFRNSANEIGFSIAGTSRGKITTKGFNGSGQELTDLNASNISSGTLSNARLALNWATVQDGTKNMSVGSIGSLAFCYTSLTRNPGATIPGSDIEYAGISSGSNDLSGTSPAGTWRCLGYVTNGMTLFVRIS